MVSIVETVIEALKDARKSWGKNVHDQFPPNFILLPVLDVYELPSGDLQAGDNKGCRCFGHYVTVDLYDKKLTGRAKRKQYESDVLDTIYAIDMGVTLENFQQIDDGDNIHLVFEFYMIGGKYGEL